MDKLNGSTVVFIGSTGKPHSATVIIEPGVGVTLIDANDKDEYLYCLRGPLALRDHYDNNPHLYTAFETKFNKAVEMLRKGYFDEKEQTENSKAHGVGLGGSDAGSHTCAFSM